MGTTCRGCGATIVWVETPGRVRVPIDPRPPIYRYNLDTGQGQKIERGLTDAYGVSHFATCPKANEFSKSKKKKAEREPSFVGGGV